MALDCLQNLATVFVRFLMRWLDHQFPFFFTKKNNKKKFSVENYHQMYTFAHTHYFFFHVFFWPPSCFAAYSFECVGCVCEFIFRGSIGKFCSDIWMHVSDMYSPSIISAITDQSIWCTFPLVRMFQKWKPKVLK